MKDYKNFQVASYVYAYYLDRADEQEIQYGIDYFNRYIPLKKVYLETHRGLVRVPREKMEKAIAVYQKNGIEVSGGITSTGTLPGNPKPSIFDTFCFTDPDYRKEYLEIVRYTASLFDEIILDDYFFTACRCEQCIEAKGTKSWDQYRLDLMEEVSHEIVDLAKSVNPKINFIIKYPNWYESYQANGYNPEKQKDIFDMVYSGTETRNPCYSQQHLQRYLSYSIIRLLDNVAPGRNGGGWIDLGGSSDNINFWLEQANLTMLARARELMLFNFFTMVDSPALPPLGQQFYRIDALLDHAGQPVGVSLYEPYNAEGEDQVVNYLGMGGIPFEPTPEFKSDAPVIFLTAASAHDPAIVGKVEAYVRQGGRAIATNGFFRAVYDQGIKDLTTVRLTNRHVSGKIYMIDHYNTNAGAFAEASDPISFEVLDYKTNSTWGDVLMQADEDNFPILTEDNYGRGKFYILNLPDNFADLYKLPKEVWRMIRKDFAFGTPVYLGSKARYNLFTYDNDVFGVSSYRPMRETLEVVVTGADIRGIRDIETGLTLTSSWQLPVPSRRGDSATVEAEAPEFVYQVPMMPGQLRFFQLLR